jgi:TldD protein
MTRRSCLLLLAAVALPALAQDDVILRAMHDEMARSKALRVVSPDPPYYIEYALHVGEHLSASATLGALVGSQRLRYSLPRIQVRVGDYQFDNTNYIGSDFYSGTHYDVGQFPLDDSYAVLRHHLWLATDMAYKSAVDAIARKRAALRNVTITDPLPDFAKAAPLVRLETMPGPPPDLAEWTARVRRLSTVFLDYPAVTASLVDFDGGQGMLYLATSEGTSIGTPERATGLRVRASAIASDGMPLRDAAMFLSLDPARFPPEAELERGVRQVAENLTVLTRAPLGESYTGPVLFEGMAAAQLFAEVLGKNLDVPRRPVAPPGYSLPFLPGELEGRLGSRILPEWMDVVDDPTQKEWRGHPLFGHYTADLEGVPPFPLEIVRRGILKNFLLTRQPVKDSPGSNGHARLLGSFGAKAAGFSNLFVRTSESVSAAELRKKLIDLCRERSKPYGIIVRKMDFPSSATFAEARRLLTSMVQSGGGRPVSLPILVYRVYPDGREELVRGLRFRGLSARSLKDIVAASDEITVFDFQDNNAPFALMGGASFVAEASVIAPSILIDDLEMETAREELPKPPIVPAPALRR